MDKIEKEPAHDVKEHAHVKQPKILVGNVPHIELQEENTDVNIDLHEAEVKAHSPVKRKVINFFLELKIAKIYKIRNCVYYKLNILTLDL